MPPAYIAVFWQFLIVLPDILPFNVELYKYNAISDDFVIVFFSILPSNSAPIKAIENFFEFVTVFTLIEPCLLTPLTRIPHSEGLLTVTFSIVIFSESLTNIPAPWKVPPLIAEFSVPEVMRIA